jgi:hypothetical protein
VTGTELELIGSDDAPIYHRLPGEPLDAYEAFTEWCKIPMSSRNLGNFLRRTAYPQKLTRKLMKDWSWDERAIAFDHDSLLLRPDPSAVDEEAAIAAQLAAASTLMELGLRAVELKNPALLSADKALKILEKGVEIQRRALGQADLNIQFTTDDLGRVNKLLGQFGDEFLISDAEVIPDDSVLVPQPEKELAEE